MLDLALPPAHLAAPAVAWNPMSQQLIEADTTFLFDPDGDAAAGYPMGQAGSIGLGGLVFSQDSSAPTFVAGRFRKGVNATALLQSFLWSPVDGLLGVSEFTFEFWLKSTADWSTLSNQSFLFCGINFSINVSHVTATLSHTHNPAVVGTYSFSTSAAISNGQYPANTFISCAVTLKNGTLTLYLGKQGDANITQVGTPASGYVPSVVWGSINRQSGIELLGGVSGRTNPALVLSDLRVSRVARTPGVIPTVSSTSTVTVGSSPTGATIQKLNGVSKPVTGWDVKSGKNVSYPSLTSSTTAKNEAALSIVRIGKTLLSAPILAGGVPDAAHPSVGHSGAFCYDWQVADRELDWVINKMGCLAYISLDGVPQILGGPTAPFTDLPLTTTTPQNPNGPGGTLVFSTSVAAAPGADKFAYGGSVWAYGSRASSTLSSTQLLSGPGGTIPGGSLVHIGSLTCGFSYAVGDAKGPPASLANWTTIALDYAYHVLVDSGLGSSIFGWGLWNTPDQPTEWTANDFADYNTLYQTTMPAIKAIDPTQRVGGPEPDAFAPWVPQLVSFVGANRLPLDFVAFHNYTGDLSSYNTNLIVLQQDAAAAGLAATPTILNGEWGWQSANTGFSPGAGTYPWSQPNGKSGTKNPAPSPQPGRVDFAANDFNAAYHASSMILQQNAGVSSAFHYTGNDTSLFDGNAVPQALYNVMRMWGMILGKNVLPVTLAADPGVQAIAAQDVSKTYVLVSNLHYRLINPHFPVTVDVSSLGVADGTAVTAYLVDTTHSNAYDTLGVTDVLTTVPVSSVQTGKVSMTLAPRAVLLLVIG